MVLMASFVFSVLYVWCKNEPDRQVSIWGFPVQSGNLPWALLAMSVLTGGNPFNDLIGIAAGHTYIFLKMTLPVSHGYDLLKTPKFIEHIVNEVIRRTNPAGVGNSRVFGLGGDRVNPNAGRGA
jgi:hypothetical protein